VTRDWLIVVAAWAAIIAVIASNIIAIIKLT
jgi:hypothetical protein